MIGFAGWVEPRLPWPGVGLALGVFAAGVVQLVVSAAVLEAPRPASATALGSRARGSATRSFGLMLPAMFGSSVAQVSILADTLIASFLVAGSISWLYYSERLIEFPLGVFGVALGTVILPRLSEQHATSSPERFSATLDWALRLVLVIACPAAIGLTVLAGPLLATLFHGGQFGARDVSMAAASVRAYAPGLVGFILVKVLAPGYFARQDTRTPVRIGVQALSLGMALKVVFRVGARSARVRRRRTPESPPRRRCAGLFNGAFLLRGLLKAGIYRPRSGWRELALVAAGANALMTVVLIFALHDARRLGRARQARAARAARAARRGRGGGLLVGLLAARPASARLARACGLGRRFGMRLYRGIAALEAAPRPRVITIGVFDGLHAGHEAILARTRAEACRRRRKLPRVHVRADAEGILFPAQSAAAAHAFSRALRAARRARRRRAAVPELRRRPRHPCGRVRRVADRRQAACDACRRRRRFPLRRRDAAERSRTCARRATGTAFT